MSRSLKDGEIDKLKSRADIYSIISDYVKLKKSGKNYSGLCPFHKEKTPSFSVDPSKQLYHCFGCGEGGDVISFIEKIENMDFIDAVEFIAKKVGYEPEYKTTGESAESGNLKKRLYEINELAKKYFQFILLRSKAGREPLNYLKERGFSDSTIEEFEIGYSMNLWNNFADFIQKRGFTKKEIIDSGLAIESTGKPGTVYDRFRGRIMFPIEDIVGKTIGFGGRIINGRYKDSRQSAKYINTPETRLYSKSNNIYNIHRAKNHIVKSDEVLIVEGYTDVIGLFQSGINNSVASMGTALTSEQINIISRFTKNIILVFDSDEAGINASLKGVEKLREYNDKIDLYFENNLNIKVAVLEKGYDPADFILKKGKEAFLESINKSRNIIDFTIDLIISKQDIENLSGKMRASDELMDFISTFSSSIIQEECIKKIAWKLDLRENLLIEELQKKINKTREAKSYPGRRIDSDVDKKNENMLPVKKIEIEALKLIIKGAGKRTGDFLELGPEFFHFEETRELYRMLRQEIINAGSGNRKVNFPIELPSAVLENSEVKKLYNYILFSEFYFRDNELDRVGKEILDNLKRIHLSEEIEYVRRKMIEYEDAKKKSNDEEIGEIERKYDSLYQRLIDLEHKKQNLGIINI
jgi:DNA primase